MLCQFSRKRKFYQAVFWRFCREQKRRPMVSPIFFILQFCNKRLFSRGVEDVAPYKFSFPYAIYSLSGWGLGGAQSLAAAKARFILASTVCWCVGGFPFGFFVKEFLKGVWGKLLARSFPHVKILISTFQVRSLRPRGFLGI